MIATASHGEPSAAPLLINGTEAAKLLGCCRQTVAQLRKDGQLKSVRVRGSIKYTRAEIQRFIDDQINV